MNHATGAQIDEVGMGLSITIDLLIKGLRSTISINSSREVAFRSKLSR
jgi:hypothetical protein